MRQYHFILHGRKMIRHFGLKTWADKIAWENYANRMSLSNFHFRSLTCSRCVFLCITDKLVTTRFQIKSWQSFARIIPCFWETTLDFPSHSIYLLHYWALINRVVAGAIEVFAHNIHAAGNSDLRSKSCFRHIFYRSCTSWSVKWWVSGDGPTLPSLRP